MQRHITHQIDKLAQKVLDQALPTTWVLIKQDPDYGKDYIVEIGEDCGALTGTSFYIQLKGQRDPQFSADRAVVKFSLEQNHARYFSDKIQDLPVFLVVVDVTRKTGWWIFVQPALQKNLTWKAKKSVTLDIPVTNMISDIGSWRVAVEAAKEWLRLEHPTSIQDAVRAKQRRIHSTDPRFDVDVLANDKQTMLTLRAKEEVRLEFQFAGNPKDLNLKLGELLDKGASMSFQPGELKVVGSPLFDSIEQSGCVIQTGFSSPGTVSLVCRDPNGNELSRVSDIPGTFKGGRKQCSFDGGLLNSPLHVRVGPIAEDVSGSVQFDFHSRCWDGQRLTQLAYFDRLYAFFWSLPKSHSTTFDCQINGNSVFKVNLPLQSESFVVPLANYLQTIWKSRHIAQRLGLQLVWDHKAIDQNAADTIEQLYGVLFEGGWSGPRPNHRLTATVILETLNTEAAKRATIPNTVRLKSSCTYTLLDEVIEIPTLAMEFTNMVLKVPKRSRRQVPSDIKSRKLPQRATESRDSQDTIQISVQGNESTIMRIWDYSKAEDFPGTFAGEPSE